MEKYSKHYNKILNILIILKIMMYLLIILDYDLYNRCIWVWKLTNKRFIDIYDNNLIYSASNGNIDYPPVYPVYEWLIAHIFNFKPQNLIDMYKGTGIELLLFQKLPALIFDLITVKILYKHYDKKSAILWCILPINILFGNIFGLSDIIIAFGIIYIIYASKYKLYFNMSIVSALLCLVKPQSLYIAIICIIYILFEKISIREKLKYIALGICITYIGWLPFIIGNRDITLPIKYYTNISGRWASLTKGAPNFWSTIQFFESYLPNIKSIEKLNIIFILISISLTIYNYYKLKNIRTAISILTLNLAMICQNQVSRYFYYFIVSEMFILKDRTEQKYSYIFISCTTFIIVTLQWYNEIASGRITWLYFMIYLISIGINIYAYVLYVKYIEEISRNENNE